jgi:hypothetical protein
MGCNPNCDGNKCTNTRGEVRRLPWNDGPMGGASILCLNCYQYEMQYRRDRNKDLAPSERFDLPAWSSLKAYSNA